MDELCRILRSYSYGASVQNNSLQILKFGKSLEKETISLSAHWGLKGSRKLGLTIKLN